MKSLISMLIIGITLFSCNTQQNSPNKNTKIVDRYFNHFNNHDWEKLASMYATTAEFKDPSLGKVIKKQTREQIAKKYIELNEVFTDIHDKILKVYPSGNDHIIIEFISTGTAPDSSTFALPICTIFTIEDGLITKDFTYYDNFEE